MSPVWVNFLAKSSLCIVLARVAVLWDYAHPVLSVWYKLEFVYPLHAIRLRNLFWPSFIVVFYITQFICSLCCSRFGTWPVAMLAQSKNKAILEGPVCNGSRVIGWHTNEKSKRLRRFHVDMSGFAFNSTILWDPKRWQCPFRNPIRQLDTVKEGFQVYISSHFIVYPIL